MICTACALAADEQPSHPPEVCDDHGREIRGCTCQHRTQQQNPPQDPDTPLEDA